MVAEQTAAVPDRRQRRRQETINEVLDIAAEIMTEEGVAGGLEAAKPAIRELCRAQDALAAVAAMPPAAAPALPGPARPT